MTAYNTGAVAVTAGSAIVKGDVNTVFNVNVSVGNLFKLLNENTFYEIASITSATKLTLSSRYANTDYHTSVPSETATTLTGGGSYQGHTKNTPVIQSYFTMSISNEDFSDDGAGVLTGDGGGSGTIDYDSGAWTMVPNSDPGSGSATASYFYGTVNNTGQYQIVTDYTPNFSWPEMSTNDRNFATIYTKGIRMIDSELAGRNTVNYTYVTKSADYTATPSDNTIVVTGNTATVNITVPYAHSANLGVQIQVINNSTHCVVATTPITTNTIDGNRSIQLQNRYDRASLHCVASGLWVT